MESMGQILRTGAENANVVRSGHGNGRVIAVVASFTPSLTIFRLELLKRLLAGGYRVVALAPERDARVEQQLTAIGVEFIPIPMERTGLNPFKDLRTLWSLRQHLKRLQPDIILPYTMKPIIYTGIAARTLGIKERYFLVTGLGHVFSEAARISPKSRLLQRICIWLYRTAFHGAKAVFVYNDADFEDIRSHRLVQDPSSVTMVPGSGVDLDHFSFSRPPQGPPVFLMVARLLRDKGVVEYVEAARQVRQVLPEARFQLLGHFDSNPTAISREEIDGWVQEGVLDYLGTADDVRPYLARSSIFVLPSYYREGIPRSILEALATGRPIITTDLPGCRDTVQPGVNGFAIKPRDVTDLARAMIDLGADPGMIATMGEASRRVAEAKFDVHAVNRLLLERMRLE